MAAVDAAGRGFAEAGEAAAKAAMRRIMKDPDSTVRQVLGRFALGFPDEMLPVRTVATGRVSKELADNFMNLRRDAGSDFADFAKDTRALLLQQLARERGVRPMDYDPIVTQLDPMLYKGNIFNDPSGMVRVQPDDLRDITRLIQEISQNSLRSRGFVEPRTLFRSENMPWNLPNPSRKGVLSFTETPENMVSQWDTFGGAGRNATWIPQEVDPRMVTYDYGAALAPRIAETEVQALFGKPLTGKKLSFEDMMMMRAKQK